MNANDQVLNRVAELQTEQSFRERARMTVADDVLSRLEPDLCRDMALGVADVLSDFNDEAIHPGSIQNAALAISTLLRVADTQDAAVSDARAEERRKQLQAEGKSAAQVAARQEQIARWVRGEMSDEESAEFWPTVTDEEKAALIEEAKRLDDAWGRMAEKERHTIERLEALEQS